MHMNPDFLWALHPENCRRAISSHGTKIGFALRCASCNYFPVIADCCKSPTCMLRFCWGQFRTYKPL